MYSSQPANEAPKFVHFVLFNNSIIEDIICRVTAKINSIDKDIGVLLHINAFMKEPIVLDKLEVIVTEIVALDVFLERVACAISYGYVSIATGSR